MNKTRLEAITGGVIAIVITVMLIELKVPEGIHFSDLTQEFHGILSYVLSFMYIGIYWINHHHLFQLVEKVNGKIIWINLHLIFWLTMIPYTTSWSAQSNYSPVPTALYAFILFMCSLSYAMLEWSIARAQGDKSVVRKVLGKDKKLAISVLLYAMSILLSLVDTRLSLLVLVVLAVLWFFPNKRIEQYCEEK